MQVPSQAQLEVERLEQERELVEVEREPVEVEEAVQVEEAVLEDFVISLP